MNTLHIVQGGVKNGDKAWLEKAARRKLSTKAWTVPKTAMIGDEVVIFIMGLGFFATAKVTSEPEPCGKYRPNRYCAGLASIRLIEPAISLSAIEHEIPALTWAIYPRSYTTPPIPVAKRIKKLIANRRMTGLPKLDVGALEEANLDELRKVALLNAQSKVVGKKGKAIYRARSFAIRRYVLLRANGSCEGCRAPAPFHKVDGSPYLEPHHTTQLSDGGPDHPARVIGLCPNCHRRAHYAEDAKQFNDSLKKKLVRLEQKKRGHTPGTTVRRR
jgi:5-methylcytosine-specific restriction endonuclease McrA